jgi:hypothetical protein
MDTKTRSKVGKKGVRYQRNPVVVRLAEGQAEVLDALGTSLGVSHAQLIRWAVEALAAKVESDGGKLTIPFRL